MMSGTSVSRQVCGACQLGSLSPCLLEYTFKIVDNINRDASIGVSVRPPIPKSVNNPYCCKTVGLGGNDVEETRLKVVGSIFSHGCTFLHREEYFLHSSFRGYQFLRCLKLGRGRSNGVWKISFYPYLTNYADCGVRQVNSTDHEGYKGSSMYRHIGRSMYMRPCLKAIERIELPQNVRSSDFTLFFGEENQIAIKHIDCFMIQYGEAATNDFLKLKLFANSFTDSGRLQKEHVVARREAKEREKTIMYMRQVKNGKDGIIDPLVETFSVRDDVIIDSSIEISKDKDEMIDPMAEISKAKTIDFMANKISSTNNDELLKEVKSHLCRMESRPNPIKKITIRANKRFKLVMKEKRDEP
ncbi:hypothetical protein FNV43_RR00359 [Rhamnella rubrinervis]|uniref:Uncharacterized protein n=1 Tax=Rhamnella rubrinervis TaxID=2594499 RepID=A0A8K0HMR1_9ROSA|nr:hypothetical protein FNV43_RR00359 [Rhamnella rubrinervis]